MRRLLFISLVIVFLHATVFAQGGVIAPYWDAAGTNCWLTPEIGICNTYIYHAGAAAANASQWLLETYGGWVEPYIAYSTVPYLNILSQPLAAPPLNSPLGGISIAYGNPLCEPLPALICTITWFCQALSPVCAGIRIVADPLATIPHIEVRDCSNNAVPGFGLFAYVDPLLGGSECGTCAAEPPVEARTWGQIKSLYN